jgi:hypothetical protein
MTPEEIENLPNLPYEQLYLLDALADGLITRYLNENGYANKTVCPECGVDDFCHVEGCTKA